MKSVWKRIFVFILVLSLGIILCNIIAFYDVESLSFNDSVIRNAAGPPFPSDNLNHLFWFVQISDLHISVFYDPGRKSDFEEFCKTTLNVINPKVVLLTGDLTDGKLPDFQGSKQFYGEWNIYKDVLHKTGIAKRTLWLDIRGNHDNFNVLTVNSSNNYFRTHSIQGLHHPGSYAHTVVNGPDKYTFIGVDACLKTGLKRPFNFFGVLSKENYLMLEKFSTSHKSNGTIWFGHYPTSTVLSSSPGMRHLMRNGLAYLCGHLHNFHGYITTMYTVHHNGLLELEVADWKDNRMYRVLAIDHGLLSFVDIKFKQWPIILITNPKHSSYLSSNSEPLYRMNNSSHIRILVFSPYVITEVMVSINKGEWKAAKRIEQSPLYVLPWKPFNYGTGFHQLYVYVKDANGNFKNESIIFSLDANRAPLSFLGKFALLANVHWVQLLFIMQIMFLVFGLCFLRFNQKYHCINTNSMSYISLWLCKLNFMVCIDSLFYPLILMCIYFGVGPWFLGNLVEDEIGIVFSWGIVLRHEYIMERTTFLIGCSQMTFFQYPLTMAIAQSVYYRVKNLTDKDNDNSCNLPSYVARHLLFIFSLIFQFKSLYTYYKSYGILALVLSFTNLWYVIIAVILWSKANKLSKLPKNCFNLSLNYNKYIATN
ncbi:SLC24A4 (predicted) [Pycnogonum litorale]